MLLLRLSTVLLQSVDMAGHNTSLFVLGVMILWFGWYGFNPGSQLAIITPAGSTYSYASAVANAAVTTSLAPAASGLTGLMLTAILLKFKTGKHHWDIMAMGNSTLAGLVAITAGCSTVYPWGAIAIGIVAGIIYPFASRLMILLKVRARHPSAAYCLMKREADCASEMAMTIGLTQPVPACHHSQVARTVL